MTCQKGGGEEDYGRETHTGGGGGVCGPGGQLQRRSASASDAKADRQPDPKQFPSQTLKTITELASRPIRSSL